MVMIDLCEELLAIYESKLMKNQILSLSKWFYNLVQTISSFYY